MDFKDFKKALAALEIELTESQYNQFKEYYAILVEENAKYNLTAITKENEVFEKHFLDSISAAKVIKLDNQKIIDIGAGAGFPLIPLKIMYPKLKATLVDATLKKVKFMELVINKLNLKDIKVINARAEDLSSKHDIVIARAVAPLNQLVELVCNIVEPNGHLIALKGSNYKQELKTAEKALSTIGFELVNVVPIELSISKATHYNLLLKKARKHDGRYPRSYSKISKQPL